MASSSVSSASLLGRSLRKPLGALYSPLTMPLLQQHGLALISLTGLLLFLFWSHLAGQTSFTYDFPGQYYTSTAYWIASIQAGEWPHWLPYESMGYPFLLNVQTGIFYLPLWLFAALHIPYTLHAANIVQIAHIGFGAWGLYLLARLYFRSSLTALCGGVAYLLFGGFYSNAEHVDIIRAFALFPWLLWSAHLSAEATREFSFLGMGARTRLQPRQLALPLLVCLYITGAYAGNVISGMVVLALYVATQSLLNVRAGEPAAAIRDAATLGCAALLGVLMAAAMLLPAFALRHEFVRTGTVSSVPHWYLGTKDFLSLFYSSAQLPAVTTGFVGDYSMMAMQLPIVLLLFLPLIRPYQLRRLAPLAVAAVFAFIMMYSHLSGVSKAITGVIPVLGLSRFPAGDYRLYVYLFVLFALLGAMDHLHGRERLRSADGLAIVAVFLCLFVVAPVVVAHTIIPQARVSDFLRSSSTALLVATLLVIALFVIRYFRISMGAYLIIVTIACVVVSAPIARAMARYWDDPRIEAYLYDSRGVPLTVGGQLQVERLFASRRASRPARADLPFEQIPWRGLIDGTYTMNGYSVSTDSQSRQAILTNPALTAFMSERSAPAAIACPDADCRALDRAHLDLADGDRVAARAVRYDRQRIVYHVALDRPALLVENETFAPGWEGHTSGGTGRLQALRVDGGLRGWAAPPGEYELTLTYRTPLLRAGAIISACAFALWAVLLGALALRPRRRGRPSPATAGHAGDAAP